MFRRASLQKISEPLWQKVFTLSLILFFLLLSDAILSTWVPTMVEKAFQSSVVMGLVISFSSVIGFVADLVFPQILRGVNFKKLLFLAIFVSVFFAFSLIGASISPFVLLFLISMASWGIYYELFKFANHQFVADGTPVSMHANVWAFIGVFSNLAYFIGPLLAGFLISERSFAPAYFAIAFTTISFLILILSKKYHERAITIEIENINLAVEIRHWIVLFRRVWPVLFIGILIGIVDSFFWTTGAVYTDELAKQSVLGRWFLPMYTLPSLFVGFVVAKKGVIHGKKKTALKFFLLCGIFLAMMNMFNSVMWQIATVFCSSFAIAISYPLVEGVYSDIVQRMGRQKKHMIGLCTSTTSISYIVGPIIAGILASVIGSVNSFSYLGYFVVVASLILLAVTPKKLKLPQEHIKKWEVKTNK